MKCYKVEIGKGTTSRLMYVIAPATLKRPQVEREIRKGLGRTERVKACFLVATQEKATLAAVGFE